MLRPAGLLLWKSALNVGVDPTQDGPLSTSLIFVNENENENVEKRENSEFVNEN